MTETQVVGVKKYCVLAAYLNSGTMPLLRNSGAALNSGNSLSCHYMPLLRTVDCMYICMYVWSSHIAEYGSTG